MTYKATAIPFGNLFERKFPRFLLSVSDNYTQFSPPTRSLPARSGSPARSRRINHTSQTLWSQGLRRTAKSSSYFAGGLAGNGRGVSIEKRGILHSARQRHARCYPHHRQAAA